MLISSAAPTAYEHVPLRAGSIRNARRFGILILMTAIAAGYPPLYRRSQGIQQDASRITLYPELAAAAASLFVFGLLLGTAGPSLLWFITPEPGKRTKITGGAALLALVLLSVVWAIHVTLTSYMALPGTAANHVVSPP